MSGYRWWYRDPRDRWEQRWVIPLLWFFGPMIFWGTIWILERAFG